MSEWRFIDTSNSDHDDVDTAEVLRALGRDGESLHAEVQSRLKQWTDEIWSIVADADRHPTADYHATDGRFTGPFAVSITTTGHVSLLRCDDQTRWYPLLRAGVSGPIELVGLSVDSAPAAALASRPDDVRLLPLGVWVNEEFHYAVDANGQRLALNPFASMLLQLESLRDEPVTTEVYGDVVITSRLTDDAGDTLGLDWRAACAIGMFLAHAEPVLHDASGSARRARDYRLVPNGPTFGGCDDGYEFVPAAVDTWGGE